MKCVLTKHERAAACIALSIFCGLNTQAQDSDDVVFDLDPFSVEVENLDSYNPNIANTGTIVAMERGQIPFTTSVITEALIDDLQIDNPADLVQQIAGVSQNENPYITEGGGNSSISYRVRGFVSEPLYNGFQTGPRVLGVDNIGRIEVSKGPNAVLYGQAPAGGIINFVPKAPLSNSHASFLVGAGSNSWERASFDLGTPLKIGAGESDNAGLRIGGGYTFFERDEPFFEADIRNLSGAFTWEINDAVKLDLQAEFNDLDNVPSRTAAFVSTGSGPDRVVDPYNRLRNLREFSYNGPHAFVSREAFLSTAYLNIRLASSLRLRIGGFYSSQDEEHRSMIGIYGLGTNETVNGARYGRKWADRETIAYKVDLLHSATVGGVDIDTLIGFENHEEENSAYEIQSPRELTVSIPFSRGPIGSDYPAPPSLETWSILDEDAEDTLDWTNIRFTQILRAMDDALTVLWGFAYGDGDSKIYDYRSDPAATAISEGDDTTYTLGLSYKLIDDGEGVVNEAIVFANTSSSFEIQSGNQQNPGDFDGFATVDDLRNYVDGLAPNPVEPQTGDGFELGVRLGMNDNKFNLTVTYFDQTRENIARTFFVRESRVAGVTNEDLLGRFVLASGEESAKGVELAFEWQPTDKFRLTGEATFMDGKVESNPEAPEEEGFGLIRSPEEMFSLYALYKPEVFSSNGDNGLEIGLGLSYNSSSRIRPQPNDRYRVSDDYTEVQALVRYNYNGYTFALNVDNVLDEEYTNEANWLSEDRSFKVTVSKKF